jgi:flagellar motor switch protein FliG
MPATTPETTEAPVEAGALNKTQKLAALMVMLGTEISSVAVEASTSVSAGVEVTRNTLEKALGSFKASDVLGRVTSSRAPVGAMQGIAEMDPRHIFNLLRDEKVQAITFIISLLSP